MEVKDLKARMGNVDIVLTIVEKNPVREFDKFGKKGRVCNATAQDATGQISLTLWNDDVDKVNMGDKIELKNGWVGEYQGSLQLSTGKFGQLSVLEKGAGTAPEPKAEDASESPIKSEKTLKPSSKKDMDEVEEEPFKDEEALESGNEDDLY